MNIRNVLRTYALLRQLSDDESVLLQTLRGLNDGERELLVESLQPAKTTKKPTQQRKIEHCAACDYTRRAAVHKDTSSKDYHEFQSSKPKSPRASALASQLSKAHSAPSGDDDERCVYKRDDGRVCFLLPDHSVHHLESAMGYHPFASSAQPAGVQSSPNGAARSSPASTETSEVDVTDAARASAGGE